MAASERRIQGYDTFKLVAAIVLLILILLCLLTLAPFAPAPVTPATPTTAALGQLPSPTPAAPTPTPNLAAPQAQAEVADGQLTLTGTGTPGSMVQIVIDGQPAGRVTVGLDGRWTFTTALTPGDHTLAFNALDDAGQAAAAGQPLTVRVPEPLAAPVLDTLPAALTAGPATLSGAGTPGSRVRILIDGQPVGETTVGPDGRWTLEADLAAGRRTITAEASGEDGATATSQPVTTEVGSAAAAPTLDAVTPAPRAGRVPLSGTGAPGGRVQIMIDGQIAGEAVVGPDGRWKFDADFAIAGERTVVVNALDAAGQVAASSEPVTVTVAAAASPTPAPPATPAPTRPPTVVNTCVPGAPDAFGDDLGQVWRVERCDTMSYIARQTNINLDDLIRANPQVVNPNLIFPGQLITLPGR